MALSDLASGMNSKPKNLSTTAWLMRMLMENAPKELITIEAMAAKGKNLLNLASSNIETLEKNNYELQETVTKAAAESPALYQTYMTSLQKLQTTVSELKDSLTGLGGSQKVEPLNAQYEKASSLLKEAKKKQTITADEKLTLEKKLLLLVKNADDHLIRQETLKKEQLITAKRFGDDARSANISVPAPTLS